PPGTGAGTGIWTGGFGDTGAAGGDNCWGTGAIVLGFAGTVFRLELVNEYASPPPAKAAASAAAAISAAGWRNHRTP
ncbi:MAG TPA: hypothetical protein VHI10_09660, partial [Mycobacterium sp.]|nr:hypothetical protein [Mycobacterium sp.]